MKYCMISRNGLNMISLAPLALKAALVAVKASAASLGLQALALFPLAMLMMSFPDWNRVVLIISIVIFIIGKIVFLIQGFRIFFTQVSSWLLFLYYLCSLEIVPIILTYVMANLMCVKIL